MSPTMYVLHELELLAAAVGAILVREVLELTALTTAVAVVAVLVFDGLRPVLRGIRRRSAKATPGAALRNGRVRARALTDGMKAGLAIRSAGMRRPAPRSQWFAAVLLLMASPVASAAALPGVRDGSAGGEHDGPGFVLQEGAREPAPDCVRLPGSTLLLWSCSPFP